MKTIIATLTYGTAKERLAVVADLLSIIGISVATLVGGAFALPKGLDIENSVGAIVLSLFGLVGASGLLVCAIAASSWIGKLQDVARSIRAWMQFALWSLLFVALLYVALVVFSVVSSMHFVR